MSLFCRILYQVGFTTWEEGLAQQAVSDQISAMFDREETAQRAESRRFLKKLDASPRWYRLQRKQ